MNRAAIKNRLKRNIAKFRGRILLALAAQFFKSLNDAKPAVLWNDNIVNKTAFSRDKGVGKSHFIISRARRDFFGVAKL